MLSTAACWQRSLVHSMIGARSAGVLSGQHHVQQLFAEAGCTACLATRIMAEATPPRSGLRWRLPRPATRAAPAGFASCRVGTKAEVSWQRDQPDVWITVQGSRLGLRCSPGKDPRDRAQRLHAAALPKQAAGLSEGCIPSHTAYRGCITPHVSHSGHDGMQYEASLC
jgi:hypothetical protein